jgi:hypothetical protein
VRQLQTAAPWAWDQRSAPTGISEGFFMVGSDSNQNRLARWWVNGRTVRRANPAQPFPPARRMAYRRLLDARCRRLFTG